MILQLGPLDCDRNILDEYSKHTLFDGKEPVTLFNDVDSGYHHVAVIVIITVMMVVMMFA